MADRSRIALLGAVIAVLVALAGMTYVWLSAPRLEGGATPANETVTLAAVRTGLPFPIAMAFASDGRVFYAEKASGRIQILGTATRNATTFYTLTGTESADERGLLGLALDPNFPASPYVYAYQTFNDGPNGIVNRIVRILADGNRGVSHTEIFRTPPLSAATNHNGGVIAFGPDGKLFALVGENAWPPFAQDPTSPMGKVLRMNSDGSAPPDNPFVNNSSWNPLVYTYGHRNMFGIAFRPTTGQAYITENGPEDSDEINRLVPGGNYGWDAVRGIANNPSYIDPIRVYVKVIVPTNAAFYTASVPAAARNRLVFGTYLTNELRALALDADGSHVVDETVLATATAPIIDVEMGLDGYLWITTPSAIYRLVPTATASPPALAFVLGIAATALPNSWAANAWVRARPPPEDRATDHPGSLSRDRDVPAVRCRRTGSRATTGSSNRSGGS